jgi:hypothetical protein
VFLELPVLLVLKVILEQQGLQDQKVLRVTQVLQELQDQKVLRGLMG